MTGSISASVDNATRIIALGFYFSPELKRFCPLAHLEMGSALANVHNADEQFLDRARTALEALGGAIDPGSKEYFPVFDAVSIALYRSEVLSSPPHLKRQAWTSMTAF